MKKAGTQVGVNTHIGILNKIINEEINVEPNGICVLFASTQITFGFLRWKNIEEKIIRKMKNEEKFFEQQKTMFLVGVPKSSKEVAR
ncbi:MAG: hypothetical protein IKE01_04125 [Clostridia bacterium]|nr:hypothetical protein [Clostridia bacterium]